MKKTAIVTGASSGIGKETALLLARNNYNLILTGRRKNRLDQLKDELQNLSDIEVLVLDFDIRSMEQTSKAFSAIPDGLRNIDVLINNAGLAAGLAPIHEGDLDDWERMIDTNVKGLLYITRLVTPLMAERKQGHIINISSIAGKETYPQGNVYCATKHAVQSLTKAMRLDLLKYGIKVSSVCPGAVETEFSLVRFHGDEQKAKDVYKGFTPLHARDIAETILFVLTRPAHVNIDDILVMPAAQAYSRDFHRE